MKLGQYIVENSTDNCKKTLDAIIGTLNKSDSSDKEMVNMAKGIMDHYKKNGSFSPDQAKWVYNTSQAMFK